MNRYAFERHTHTYFYLLFALMLSLIFIRYALQVDIPRIIFMLFFIVIAILGSRTEILAICMCCIPLHSAIGFNSCIICCLAIYILKYYKTLRIKPVLALVLIMLVWELLHGFSHNFSIRSLISCFVPIIALMIIMCTEPSDYDYDFLVRILAVTTVMVCIMSIGKLVYFANFDFEYAITYMQRLGQNSTEHMVLSGSNINPNSLGIICILASTGLLQLCSVGKGKILDYLFVGILLVFGLLTSSRTFFVCMLLMLLLLLLSQRGGLRKKGQFLILCIFALFCITAFLMVIFPGRIEHLFYRFQVDDITSGRAELMTDYHEFILANPDILFWGIGFQDFVAKILELYKISFNAPHNCIQEIMVGWGLPGLLMTGLLLGMMVFYSKCYSGKRGLLSFIPLIIILAKSMVGQMLTSGYTMLALSFAYLSLCQNFEQSQEYIDEKT